MNESTPTMSPPNLPLGQRLRRLSRYFLNQRLAWSLAVIGTIVGASTEPLAPAFLQPLLDQGFTNGTLPLWVVPLALLGLFIVRGVAQFTAQYALTRIANEGMMRLRRDLFERLLCADFHLFKQQSASALSNTVVYEVQTGSTLLVQAVLGFSRDGFTVIALLCYLLNQNWQLTMIVAVVVPCVNFIMRTLSKRLYRLTRASQQATDELAYVVEENVLAHRMVRLHAAQPTQFGRFNTLSQALRRLAIKSTIASAAMTPLTQLLAAGALSIVICVALWQSRQAATDVHNQITVGGFAAFITAMLMLISPIRRLTDVVNPLTRGLTALERGLHMLDTWLPENSGQHTQAMQTCDIELREVSVHYPDAPTAALQHINLHIGAGEVVALVGPSGSGKTTLVNLLPRFVNPSSGDITLGGVSLQQWALPALRQQFAMVSQDVVMFNDSIANNVCMGAPMDEARVLQCLQAANLGEYIQRQPLGIHAPVGHNASQLSGGQRQRLAIARALYKNAPILILDEATSALDNESERLVQEALQRLMVGRTTLVIAHRLSTIEHAHRVVVMAEGRILEQGTHQELLQLNGLYARLRFQGGLRDMETPVNAAPDANQLGTMPY